MLSKRIWICAIILLLTAATAAALNDTEQLGKNIFFDKELSINKNQACAACHSPQVGFTGTDSIINVLGSVYEGSIAGRFGNRKPPAAAYAGDSPVLNNSTGMWIGGMFWDGRATGRTLGDPLAEQAKGPFLNPMEQGLPNASCVVYRVITSNYSDLYKQVWGNDSFSVEWPKDVNKTCSKEHGQVNLSSEDRNITDTAYNNIARSIAAYERSTEVSPFSSKYDYYRKGNANLTKQEMRGLALFNNSTKARCANCHEPPLFTDFSYHNLGIPKNLMNPFYYEYRWNGMGGGINWIDNGLGEFLNTTQYQSAAQNNGKHKVPTLRNVDKRPYPSFIKAYGHNGYFKSLEEIVHFYNTRDVRGAGWKGKHWLPAEVSANVNKTELGNLSLTPQDESDIVAFLKTLSDGYTPKGSSYNISVSTSPGGLSPQPAGGGQYTYGENITVTAQPVNGYTFHNWTEGGSQVSTSTAYQFIVTGNRNLKAVYTQNTSSGSLAGWWRFDNESGENSTFFRDWSNHGNNATCLLTSCPTITQGKFGKALYFDGSKDYINAGNGSSLDITGNITIEAWVKPERLETAYLVKKATRDSTDGYELSLSKATGKAYFRVNQKTSHNTYKLFSTSSYPLNGNTWVHLVGVYNGSHVQIYFNGKLENSMLAPAKISSNTDDLKIGGPDDARYFKGTIDEVRIWNRALSPEEINNSYNSGI